MHYVKLKENHDASGLVERIDALTLGTPEERFPFEDLAVEVYKMGTLEECQSFVSKINDKNLQAQFEIVEK